jgi:hypothetical protein
MRPNLAQVLNTLAHEIRSPLSVSQGYLKLYLDGRLKDEDARRAFEQTRQALGALATLCVDMGKVSTLSDSGPQGIPGRVSTTDFVAGLREQPELKDVAWADGGAAAAAIEEISTPNTRELAQAVAIVAKAAFDEARDSKHAVRTEAGDGSDRGLIVLAGVEDSIPALQAGPSAPGATAVDFGKGGKGLKLIWAAFVLDKHGVQTWTDHQYRASVGFRIPVVNA